MTPSEPIAAPTSQDAWSRAFNILLLAAALAAVGPNNADPDIWGHVRYGQEVLATGRLPRTATHTFTADGYPWINHENLAELCFANLANLGGGAALLLLKFVAAFALFGLLLSHLERQRLRLLTRAVIVLIVALNLTSGWSVRPQLFTYLFFAIMLELLERAFAGSPERAAPGPHEPWPRTLWLLPLVPLFAVWTNTHGGFLAGFGVCGLYLGAESAELLWRQGRRALHGVSFLGLLVAACGLATLATPYGYELYGFLREATTVAPPEITEWAPLAPHQDLFVPCAVLLALVAAGVFGGRGVPRWAHLVVLAVVAYEAVTHVRHIAFLALACGFFLGPRIETFFGRLQRAPAADDAEPVIAGRKRQWLLGGICATAMLLGVAISARLWVLRVDRKLYPVDAFQYMADQGLNGRMVVFFDWAQYALSAFAPAGQLQFDGRFNTCYPQEVIDEHFDFLLGEHAGRRLRSPHSPPIEPTRVLRTGDPDLVVTSRLVPHSTDVMEQQADWVLLYQDGLAQVWGRRARYDDPRSPQFIDPAQRRISDAMPRGYAAWPALPRRRAVAAAPAPGPDPSDQASTRP